MAPCVSEHLGVGRMIGILHGDHGVPQWHLLVAQISRKLLLGVCRPDAQDLVRSGERKRDVLEKLPSDDAWWPP
jgi:hypothetical protein